MSVRSTSSSGAADMRPRFITLEGGDGIWTVTFRRVPYNIEAAARWAEAHAYHGVKEAAQLRTGRG